MSNLTKVAVYGTLLSNLHNNYLLGDSPLLGKGVADFQSTMFSRGGFPILDLGKSLVQNPVAVEVYEVTPATLQRLDQLEGYPTWYDRTTMPFTLESGEQVEAFIYHQDVNHGLPVVESNNWKTYCELARN